MVCAPYVLRGKLEVKSMVTPWIFHGIIMLRTYGFPWNFHIILPTWNFHGLCTMGIPWTTGRQIHGMQTMEISYGQNYMKIPSQFHGNPWVATMIIPWNSHGIFISFCPHEISMVCTPWVFHGTPGVISMVIPWKYHGRDPMDFHGTSMVCKPWKFQVGKMIWKFHGNYMEFFSWNHHGGFP